MLSNSELQISSTNPGGESGCKSFCSSISWFWSCQTAFNAILFDLTTIYNNFHVDHPPKLKQSEYAVEEVKTQTNHLVAQCSCFLLLNHETTEENKAEEPLISCDCCHVVSNEYISHDPWAIWAQTDMRIDGIWERFVVVLCYNHLIFVWKVIF